ncbi:MAG: COG2426 family protein [Caulobacteraceae bacterium]
MDNILQYAYKDILIMLVAMVPVLELRGAIPIGIAMGVSPFWSMILSVIGSTIPVPLILLGLRPVFDLMKKVKLIRKVIDRTTIRALRKSDNVLKYGFWGLMIFVGIPLPGTGAWTGSLIAVLLNMRIKVAFPAIFIGNIIAGTIIYILSYTTFSILNFL